DMAPEGSNCLLNMEEDVLRFQFQKDNETVKQITLNSGYKRIADTFFKRNIPNEAEIESAINCIEDELMSNKGLLGRKGYLFSSDRKLISIFNKNGLVEHSYSRQSVEDLFSRYARVMMGAPASEVDAEITREDVAIILVLREIMHHLDFEELRISA
ncbi:MAG TPA: hypothetical protein VK973_10900, partial [Arenicellales bacterium]|nr:hypothetical protein [Arenicellales bacterium]